MFTYWQGYEIDGSSTAYNLVVPQRKLIAEVLVVFTPISFITRYVGTSIANYWPDGLIFNKQALSDNMNNKHFTIDLEYGPGFIYEYAAYIVSKIAGCFPEVGIDGGIDCAGGFVDGCTYSYSLYGNERITLTTEKIGETIKQLIQKGIVKPHSRSGNYGRDIIPCSQLSLFNLYNVQQWKDELLNSKDKIIKGIASNNVEYLPDEYERFVQKLSKITIFDRVEFMHYCTCYVKIGDSIGALTCISENDRLWLEFRVPPAIREELEKQLFSYKIKYI